MTEIHSARLPAVVGTDHGEKPTLKATLTAAGQHVTNTLDALSPACAPFAARWDAEADRRMQLRTPENLKKLIEAQRANTSARSTAATTKSQAAAARKARPGLLGALSAERRAARTASTAARGQARMARANLKAAKANYPATLRTVATVAHSVHAVPAGVVSVVSSTPSDWTMWPASVSASLVGLNAVALWLGRRKVVAQLDDDLSAEERRLAARLDPSYWVQHAEERGLSGTLPTPAELTPAGLVSHVRLDGRWTPKAFRAKADEIRAMLGARTDLRMEIKAGTHGDRATITLRTRSAADGMSLTGWEPGAPWGVDMVTGEPIMAPLGKRILLAGTSGSGKSWSARPLLAEASERPDHRLVIFDRKHVEARNWEHRARTACELDDMSAVMSELIAEGEARLKTLPRGKDVVPISPDQPRITVFVDEMAELLSDCKKDHGDVIEGMRTIARKYRAAEIILVSATQKPALSGPSPGLDSQIAGQLTVRLSLAVSTSTESRVVFGDDATEKGWNAHELPMPGVALLRDQDKGPKSRPVPFRMRAMSPQDVIALPDRPVWSREATPQKPTGAPLTLLKGAQSPAGEPVKVDPDTNAGRVLRSIQGGATTNRQVADETGLNKGTVSTVIQRLITDGHVTRTEDGLKAKVDAA